MELNTPHKEFLEERFQPTHPNETFGEVFEPFRPEMEQHLESLAKSLEAHLSQEIRDSQEKNDVLRSQIKACINFAEAIMVKETIMQGMDIIALDDAETQNLRKDLGEKIQLIQSERLKELAEKLGIKPTEDTILTRTIDSQGQKRTIVDGIIPGRIRLPEELSNAIDRLSHACSIILGDNFRNQKILMAELTNLSDSTIANISK